MNYIWELLVRGRQQGISHHEITFTYPERFSPYTELSFEHLNQEEVMEVADVNPYYRFNEVFQGYFHPDYLEDKEVREVLFDIIIHYLANLDSYKGMTKREYHINFTIREIESGIFGETVREGFQTCTLKEKKIIAENVLRLHQTGEGIYLFQDSIRKVFEKSTIFANNSDRDMLLIHLAVPETREREQKIQLLKTLFLPFKYEMRIYWEYLFGVVGVPELMKQGEILMYEE